MKKIDEAREQVLRSLLLMKYDTSKTLTENEIKVISEQASSFERNQENKNLNATQSNSPSAKKSSFRDQASDDPNYLSADEIEELTDDIVDALDGLVDEQDLRLVYNSINSLKGKCVKISDTEIINAMDAVEKDYRKNESWQGEDLYSTIEGVGEITISDIAKKLKKDSLALIPILRQEKCATTQNAEKPEDNKTEDKKTEDKKTVPVVGGGGEKCQGTQKYCKIRNILAGECLETTGFKTEDEGNAFRKWVNEKYPDYAKKIQLDYPAKATGRYDNCYIRLAWKQYGTEYKPIETKPEREENQMDGKDLEAAPVSDAEE